jgi:hypothetical protein
MSWAIGSRAIVGIAVLLLGSMAIGCSNPSGAPFFRGGPGPEKYLDTHLCFEVPASLQHQLFNCSTGDCPWTFGYAGATYLPITGAASPSGDSWDSWVVVVDAIADRTSADSTTDQPTPGTGRGVRRYWQVWGPLDQPDRVERLMDQFEPMRLTSDRQTRERGDEFLEISGPPPPDFCARLFD